MAIRKMVKIDEELCDGCGECVPACAEGAIQIIDGKARLVGDNLCDGLGACLGDCPQGAITVEEREADEFDEAAVASHLAGLAHGRQASRQPAQAFPGLKMAGGPEPGPSQAPGGGCPGSRVLTFDQSPAVASPQGGEAAAQPSTLRQWPVQLHLLPPVAPYLQGADLLLAADCTSFALGDFHSRYLAGKALAIACPKLDHNQEVYLEKLVAMIEQSLINTLTVMIMEVPCCSGLLMLAKQATTQASRKVPVKVVVVGVQGNILTEEWA